MTKKLFKLAICAILTSVIVCCSVFASSNNTSKKQAIANERVLSLGADLSNEQKELIKNYLSIDDSVTIIETTHEDEVKYLGNILSPAQIGNHTYSCAYIEPTDTCEIHVKTVNLNGVSCEMIRNALLTSGIDSCNIIAVAPIEVSGTGSLAGIFKAYEEIYKIELDTDKKELASEELVRTAELSKLIGDDEASDLMKFLKEKVLTNGGIAKDELFKIASNYLKEKSLNLSEEEKWQLVELILKFSGKDYDINKIKETYEKASQTLSDIKEAAEKTKNILEKIWDFLVDLWHKIVGTYEKFKQTEQYEQIKQKVGILSETKDKLLGENTVVTTTESDDISEVIDKVNNPEPEKPKEKKKPWYKKLWDSWFGSKDSEQTPQSTPEVSPTPAAQDEVTFEDFSKLNEQDSNNYELVKDNSEFDQVEFINFNQNVNEETTESSSESNPDSSSEDTGLLQYITYELQNGIASKPVNGSAEVSGSFDDLFK